MHRNTDGRTAIGPRRRSAAHVSSTASRGRRLTAGWPLLLLSLLALACDEPRSVDGSGNNPYEPDMGAVETALRRYMPARYGGAGYEMAGADRPSPREISNKVVAQYGSIPEPHYLSDWFWQWGQFLDHDIDLSPEGPDTEYAPIPVPKGDPWFDPNGTGTQEIPLHRTSYEAGTGTSPGNPRQQLNHITAWIDGSMVYGSDTARADELRELDGSGRMKTSAGDLLPFNVNGFDNAGGSDPTLFLAGDVRANEQVGLTAAHTLFVREHNYWADRIRAVRPGLSGENIYQAARAIVIAEIQVITYQEFLPALFGPYYSMPRYRGYRPHTDASISNIFSTAAYRLGHSMLSPTLKRIDRHGDVIPAGNLPLRDAFFNPQPIIAEGIDSVIRGLAWQVAQRLDAHVVDDVRNFLFGLPGQGGFDLASLNIQRGRDHGLPSYNDCRAHLGMRRARSFRDITSDPQMRARLRDAYGHPNKVDIWVGGLAEDRLYGSVVGPVFYHILMDQFVRLRDGDRYWWELFPNKAVRRYLSKTRLADVIRRNTGIGYEISDDVFRVPHHGGPPYR